MTFMFVDNVPPSHGQGNRIPYAAIRWPDFGDRPAFGRPFARIFRHSDTPRLSFWRAVDVPGLRRSGPWSRIIDQARDFPERFPRHRHLGQLERDVPAEASENGLAERPDKSVAIVLSTTGLSTTGVREYVPGKLGQFDRVIEFAVRQQPSVGSDLGTPSIDSPIGRAMSTPEIGL